MRERRILSPVFKLICLINKVPSDEAMSVPSLGARTTSSHPGVLSTTAPDKASPGWQWQSEQGSGVRRHKNCQQFHIIYWFVSPAFIRRLYFYGLLFCTSCTTSNNSLPPTTSSHPRAIYFFNVWNVPRFFLSQALMQEWESFWNWPTRRSKKKRGAGGGLFVVWPLVKVQAFRNCSLVM